MALAPAIEHRNCMVYSFDVNWLLTYHVMNSVGLSDHLMKEKL